MISQVVVVDFSHLFHVSRAAALNAPPEYDVTKTTIDNVVGKLRTVKAALKKEGVLGYDLVFAEDRVPERKLALLPTYRQGREDLREEKNKVKEYLLQNGSISRFCHSPSNEADDCAATICRLILEQENINVTVVSGDRDLWQMIQPRVRVYNPINRTGESTQKGYVTDADIEKAFKCRPIQIALYKSLWGDSGDCVPNVMPRTKKLLLPIILKTDGSLDALITRIESTEDRYYLTPKCFSMWESAQAEIVRNWNLVKLDDQCQLVWE